METDPACNGPIAEALRLKVQNRAVELFPFLVVTRRPPSWTGQASQATDFEAMLVPAQAPRGKAKSSRDIVLIRIP
jgi:hypothetical protein